MDRRLKANIVMWVGFAVLACPVLWLVMHSSATSGGKKARQADTNAESSVSRVLEEFEKNAESVRIGSASWQLGRKSEELLNLLMDEKYADLQRAMEAEYVAPMEWVAGNCVNSHAGKWVDVLKVPMKELMPKLDAWVAAYPDSTIPYTVRSVAYYKYAWEERGGDFASKTSDKQMGNFKALLEVGQEDATKALEIDPQNVPAWRRMIAYAFLLGGREAGNQAFAAAVARVPDAYLIYYAYLDFMQDKWYGNDGEAVAIARKLTKDAPDDSILHLVLIEAHTSEALWQEQKADVIDTSSTAGQIAQWWSEGKPKKTRKDYYADPVIWQEMNDSIRKLTQHHPRLTFALVLYAEALMDVGYKDEALAYYRRAAEIEPNYDRTGDWRYHGLYLLANVPYEKEKYEEALPLMKRYAIFYPNEAAAQRMLAYAYYRLNRFEEALAHYTQAVLTDPQDAFSMAGMCSGIYIVYGPSKQEQALSYCDRAIAVKPDDAFAHETRAWLLEKLGREQEAAADRVRARQLQQSGAH